MALAKKEVIALNRTYALSDKPSKASIKTLKNILDLEQHAWSIEFENKLNRSLLKKPVSKIFFIGGASLYQNGLVLLSIKELVQQGWLASALIDHTLAQVRLPQFVPDTTELDSTVGNVVHPTSFALAFHELLWQHQRLLRTVINNKFKSLAESIPTLTIGAEIPLKLAELLIEANIAYCYEDSPTKHMGNPVAVADGALITLSIIDTELAAKLAQKLRFL